MKLVVHKFTISDVDDVDIYAAEPLYAWEKSEAGQWVMANAVEPPEWHKRFVHDAYYYIITVTANFTEEMAIFYQLKWGNK